MLEKKEPTERPPRFILKQHKLKDTKVILAILLFLEKLQRGEDILS